MIPTTDIVANGTPTGWRTVPFWSLFRREKKTGFPEEELLSVYRDYGVIPKSSRDDNHNKESEDLSGYQLVTEGALVTNKMKAWQGSIAISRYRGIVSPAYYVYTPQSHECDQFLHYLLRSDPYIGLYGRISKGVRVNQWDLEHEALRNIPVLLPDLATQRQIADFLDRETARIDLLIEKKQRLVALLGERLAHLVRNLVTRGTTDNPELVQTDLYWCPLLPKNWQVRKGFHIGRLVGSTSGEETEDDGEATVQYIKVADLNACDGDRLVSTKAMIRPQSTFRPQPKDFLVFPKRGAAIFTNKVAIAPAKSAIDPNLMGWVIFEGYEPEYFMWVLKTRTLDNLADVSTVPQINNKHIYPERFPVPPTEEQKKIVKEIARVRSLSFAMTDRNQLSIERLKEYRSALITAAVTGQIDVTTYAKSGTPDHRLDAIQEEMGA